MSSTFNKLAWSLHDAFDNAEQHFHATHDQEHRTDRIFRAWLLEHFGIVVGIGRRHALLNGNRYFWNLTHYEDEEKLIMFKLTYG